jgi:urease accessory protein
MVRFVVLVLGMMVSGMALAHPGPHPDGAFATGFWHPFSGIDHLLAMICVGLWAAQLGGRFRLMVPAAFVISMGLGTAMGAAGIPLGSVESGIALSVLMLGALVALSVRVAWYWAMALVSAFAVFHGHAHGSEIPFVDLPAAYFTGLLTATMVLHCVGVISGVALRQRDLIRAIGAAIGLAGLCLFFA